MENQIPQTPTNDKKNVGKTVATTVVGVKQAEFDEMKNRLAKLEELFASLQTQTISKAEHEAQINEANQVTDEKIHNLQTEAQEMQDKIDELEEENGKLRKLFECKMGDVLVDGQIDYEKLDGKILVVRKLEQKYGGKWYANDRRIIFEDGNFIVATNEINTTSRKGYKPYADRIIFY